MKAAQEQIKKDQQDIQEQREQLYRKMEILSNQGLLISPNVAIPAPIQNSEIDGQAPVATVEDHHIEDRRKSWKPAPAIKPSAVNLTSAQNSPKLSSSMSMKQQLPLKLSTLSK